MLSRLLHRPNGYLVPFGVMIFGGLPLGVLWGLGLTVLSWHPLWIVVAVVVTLVVATAMGSWTRSLHLHWVSWSAMRLAAMDVFHDRPFDPRYPLPRMLRSRPFQDAFLKDYCMAYPVILAKKNTETAMALGHEFQPALGPSPEYPIPRRIREIYENAFLTFMMDSQRCRSCGTPNPNAPILRAAD